VKCDEIEIMGHRVNDLLPVERIMKKQNRRAHPCTKARLIFFSQGVERFVAFCAAGLDTCSPARANSSALAVSAAE